MARFSGLPALVALLVSLFATTGFADDKLTRPRLENYASYNEFLAAMYSYKKQLELEKKFADSLVIKIDLPETAAETGGAVSSMPAKSPELSPLSDVYVPPLVINGPEDLEYAIAAARNFLHPVYTEQLRYNRTTAQSFPLKPVDTRVLEETAVNDGLKLNFSTDNEMKVAEGLAAVTNQKVKEASDQDKQESDINARILRQADMQVTPGAFIMGSDLNPVTISVSSH